MFMGVDVVPPDARVSASTCEHVQLGASVCVRVCVCAAYVFQRVDTRVCARASCILKSPNRLMNPK